LINKKIQEIWFPDYEVTGNWKVAPNNFVHAIQELPVRLK